MKAMDKKLFLNLVFTIVGSVILLTMGIIVGSNFIRDSRLLHPSAPVVAVQTPKPTTTPETDSSAKETTFKYKRAADAAPVKTDLGEATPKPTTTPTLTPTPGNTAKNIKIEVVNYSGIKNLAEEIRAVLEASGYTVSAGNAESAKPVATTIIEWNDKNAGAEVQKLLKAGKLVKTPDPNSRFDVTIHIGDDFKP